MITIIAIIQIRKNFQISSSSFYQIFHSISTTTIGCGTLNLTNEYDILSLNSKIEIEKWWKYQEIMKQRRIWRHINPFLLKNWNKLFMRSSFWVIIHCKYRKCQFKIGEKEKSFLESRDLCFSNSAF